MSHRSLYFLPSVIEDEVHIINEIFSIQRDVLDILSTHKITLTTIIALRKWQQLKERRDARLFSEEGQYVRHSSVSGDLIIDLMASSFSPPIKLFNSTRHSLSQWTLRWMMLPLGAWNTVLALGKGCTEHHTHHHKDKANSLALHLRIAIWGP